jgi:cardiolipin synthase C
LIAIAALYFGGALIFQSIYAVPSTEGRENSRSLGASEETALGDHIIGLAAQHPGKSGVAPLIEGPTAFAARIVLAGAAEATIDARYYIWQKDLTGLLLLESLYEAAERGVRVRLLLDDNGIPDLDPELAEMDAHPNIEVRIFNPFVLRSPRIVSYALDFGRLNRRMHNKSMTFDSVAAIIGGRNIGDIYFYRNEEVNYFDFDVAVIGEAAREVEDDFDLYWASDSAIEASKVLPPADPDGGVLARSVAAARAAPGGLEYQESIESLKLLDQLADDARGFDWAEMKLVSDDPAKGLGRIPEEGYLYSRLLDILSAPQTEVDLISAYFVPGPVVREALTRWAENGIKVRTLTNAQEATDVLPVHGAYQQYRNELLQSGVELYELKSTQELRSLVAQFGLVGSRNSSLHAKTFVVDRSELFVGSYNFDARSAFLNTEMGFLIDSPQLAAEIYEKLDTNLDEWAYQVVEGEGNDLRWVDRSEGPNEIVHDTEPNTTALSRGLAKFIGYLPIEWML